MKTSIDLGDLMATKAGSVDPSKFPDEVFDLYSIPSFDSGLPEIAIGSSIGSAKQVVKSGDVLLSKIVPHIRRSWVVGDERGRRLIASGEWIVFRSEKIEPRYLRHVLVSDPFHAQFMQTVSGVGGSLLRARPAQVAKIKIPLPPLPEQRRIAAILDQADALRAKRREALAQLDSLTQSIFVEMFGDPVKNTKSWPILPFGKVCETRLGKMLDQKQQTGKHLRKYLRNANVQWFRFDLTDVFEMDFDDDARSIFRLRAGDLLICEGGEPGRAAIWRDEITQCYYQKALHRGRPVADKVTAEYLVWLLWFFAHRGGLGDHVTSATIAHLTGEKLKAMSIPVPPIALQHEFAERLMFVDKIKSRLTESLGDFNALFASLQNRAFRGEL